MATKSSFYISTPANCANDAPKEKVSLRMPKATTQRSAPQSSLPPPSLPLYVAIWGEERGAASCLRSHSVKQPQCVDIEKIRVQRRKRSAGVAAAAAFVNLRFQQQFLQ
ncbi:unnamed protein product [Ceratitis capitata]|uniref:(Mediterranean fruit fly) hypothetical protein n=1 Tax=Ceratitis capitata TaxID=7213 RepID=A0A811V0V3_CERCA|nr:unnamed protein product [Ceratitis capitata]